MSRKLRESRKYAASPLPTLRGSREPADREILLALYAQVCVTWRELIGTRFKLLGLVPTISVLLQAAILSGDGFGKGLSPLTKIGLAVFGFLATLGLLIYDLRNSELHDDLISRGRKIEEELGVDTGQFRGRLGRSHWFISHSIALLLIYGTAILGWVVALLITTGLLRRWMPTLGG